MSYNTLPTFKAMAFPQGAYDDIPDATIQMYLNQAKSMVDAALRPKHTLPLQDQSDELIGSIRDAEMVIACYRLMQYRGVKASVSGSADEVLRERYLEITHPEHGFLSRLARGNFMLDRSSDQTYKRERRSQQWGTHGVSFRTRDCKGRDYV